MLVRVFPRAIAYPFCRTLAELIFWLDSRHRRIGMINLRIAFPDKNDSWRKDVLRKSFRQLGDHVVEVSRLLHVRREELLKHVYYEEERGLENYLKAKELNQATLFLTAHISAWELLPAVHAAHGYPLKFVVRPLDNPWLEHWVSHLRNKFGNRVIAKQGSMKRILKTLNEGGDVGFLIDQNIQEREGIYVPFFGYPASTSSTLAALALKTGAPVVAGFIYPEGRTGQYRIRFYPPIQLENTGNFERDLREGTALFNRRIEEVIREYPHCWLWGHRRFHTQPGGQSPYESLASKI